MNRIENNQSTRRTIECARKSFESVTGKKVKDATLADIEKWLGILREKGRSASTCRTYLSFVKQKAGLDVELPKRGHVESRTLSDVEVKDMLSTVHANNYALLAALVLCGPDVLTFTWGTLADLTAGVSIAARIVLINEANRRGHDTSALLAYGNVAHFVGGVDLEEIIFPNSHHDINRKLKSIARKAGIGIENINITAMKNTNKRLMAEYKDADKAARILGIAESVTPLSSDKYPRTSVKNAKRDPRLHGMFRRSSAMKSA